MTAMETKFYAIFEGYIYQFRANLVAKESIHSLKVEFVLKNIQLCTLTDLDSSCPRSLLKTIPPPQGKPLVSGGRYATPEPRFKGLMMTIIRISTGALFPLYP